MIEIIDNKKEFMNEATMNDNANVGVMGDGAFPIEEKLKDIVEMLSGGREPEKIDSFYYVGGVYPNTAIDDSPVFGGDTGRIVAFREQLTGAKLYFFRTDEGCLPILDNGIVMARDGVCYGIDLGKLEEYSHLWIGDLDHMRNVIDELIGYDLDRDFIEYFEIKLCEDCQEHTMDKYLIDVGNNYSYHWVCSDCEDNYRECEKCNEHKYKWEFNDEYGYCEDCAAEYLRECFCCGDIYDIEKRDICEHDYKDELKVYYDEWICDDCVSDLVYCGECDAYHDQDYDCE